MSRFTFPVLLVLSLAACTTTSDVIPRGDGSFVVSSAACPACGGSSKSASLAYQKASEFCEERGQIAVIEDASNRNVNAMGAGASEVSFRCSKAYSIDDQYTCFDEKVVGIAEQFGREPVVETVPKVIPSEVFGFESIANTSMPDESQRSIILAVGGAFDECAKPGYEAMPNDQKTNLLRAHNALLVAIADLAAGKVTFGDYAKIYNRTLDELAQADQALARDYREQRAREAQSRERAMENYYNNVVKPNLVN